MARILLLPILLVSAFVIRWAPVARTKEALGGSVARHLAGTIPRKLDTWSLLGMPHYAAAQGLACVQAARQSQSTSLPQPLHLSSSPPHIFSVCTLGWLHRTRTSSQTQRRRTRPSAKPADHPSLQTRAGTQGRRPLRSTASCCKTSLQVTRHPGAPAAAPFPAAGASELRASPSAAAL